MQRRFFLMGSAAATTAIRSSALPSANERVRVACVGVRGQGQSHIRAYSKMPNVEIAAICDVDESVLEQRLQDAEKLTQKRPAGFTDLRKLLEDKSIDAISIATPNHSHALQAIWGCQAGKDVYVEKPCAYNIFEAQQLGAAVKKYKRMVQHGTNGRSSATMQEAVRLVREGVIGDVYMSRGLVLQVARHHRPETSRTRPRRRALRPLARARSEKGLYEQSLPLQLPLVLGLRQWRSRQPRCPSNRCRAVATRRELSDNSQRYGRSLYVR